MLKNKYLNNICILTQHKLTPLTPIRRFLSQFQIADVKNGEQHTHASPPPISLFRPLILPNSIISPYKSTNHHSRMQSQFQIADVKLKWRITAPYLLASDFPRPTSSWSCTTSWRRFWTAISPAAPSPRSISTNRSCGSFQIGRIRFNYVFN